MVHTTEEALGGTGTPFPSPLTADWLDVKSAADSFISSVSEEMHLWLESQGSRPCRKYHSEMAANNGLKALGFSKTCSES